MKQTFSENFSFMILFAIAFAGCCYVFSVGAVELERNAQARESLSSPMVVKNVELAVGELSEKPKKAPIVKSL